MNVETLEKAINRSPFAPLQVQTAAGQVYQNVRCYKQVTPDGVGVLQVRTSA